MKTYAYVSFFRLICLVLLSGGLSWAQAQDQTVSGNLTVNGNETVTGSLIVAGAVDFNTNTLSFGTNTATASSPGLVLTYTDTTNGTVSTITLGTSGTSAIWQWERNSANGLIPQMKLSDASNSNILTIYTPTATPSAGIILDPSGTSTFANSIIATGTNSRLPNQQLTGTGSILTQGLGDGRYLTQGSADTRYVQASNFTVGVVTTSYGMTGPTIALPGGHALGPYSFAGMTSTASGEYSTAMGLYATASGYTSTVMGEATKASGNYSTAMGYFTTASGGSSTAMGFGTKASGGSSTAMGVYTTASGQYSTAMGYGTTASGGSSTAMGGYTTASGSGQLVIGQYNIPLQGQGDLWNWVPTDALFIIGNGSGVDLYDEDENWIGIDLSNAFVVKKNGDTVISGTTSISGGLNVAGNITLTSTSSKLIVTGTNSTHIAPQGDLSMGEFTAGQ